MRLSRQIPRSVTRTVSPYLISVLIVLTLTGCANPSVPQTPPPTPVATQSSAPTQASPPPTPATSSIFTKFPKVILGQDNWLYYGEPINKLLSDGDLTDAQLKQAVDELVYINNSLKAQGVHFLFVLTADKQLIYPEFMPEKYQTGRPLASYERMSAALKTTGIDFIDSREVLLARKNEVNYRLYYMRDQRWNQLGDFYITQEIMSHLGKSLPVPQYKLDSVDTSSPIPLSEEVGNDLNYMNQSLVQWTEPDVPKPVYTVSQPEQVPSILWYGDCFSAPLTDFVQKDWQNSLTYVSLWTNYGFPLSLRGDLQKRLDGQKVVVLELDEHYRQDISRMLSHTDLPKPDPTWRLDYSWPADSFAKTWQPLGDYPTEVTKGQVLVTSNDTAEPASFYSTTPLSFKPNRIYYLAVNMTAPDYTGMLADFCDTPKGEFSFDWLQGQMIYKGENTIFFEFPKNADYVSSIESLRIYLGDIPGTYGISNVTVYSKPR